MCLCMCVCVYVCVCAHKGGGGGGVRPIPDGRDSELTKEGGRGGTREALKEERH